MIGKSSSLSSYGRSLFRELPQTWRIVQIKDLKDENILSDVQDGNHGERHPKASDYVAFGVPFIMAKDLTKGSLDLENCNFISRQQADSLRIGFAKPDDVLLTHKATIGRVAIVIDNYEYVMLSPQVTYYRISDKKKLDSLFLKYIFLSPVFQYQLNSSSDQSTRKYIGITAQRSLWLPLPPISEQKAIAHILGTLDDKIELNQQMNRNLEAIAQTIFKSWFIDFDPVRSKMEGRQTTGMDANTAALFPDSFEDSLLGEIPKGWEIKLLDRIANFLNGLALQKYSPIDDEYLPAIKIAELRRGVTESSGRASSNIKTEYVVEDGDILFSWSGSLEVCIWCGGRGALNQHLFKVTSADYPKWFYYQWVKYYLPNFQAIAASKATTMGHIQRHHLTEAQVLVPPADTLQMMDKKMTPLLNRIVSNSLESRALRDIRDSLLPKLMSGEIRVKEAEEILEDVA